MKIDVSKFYPSINHDILKKMLRKKFKDKRLLSLFDKIIDSYPKQTGVPIGSYLSQYLANFYLAYFDHWLKEEMGVKYVVRFADDMVIYGASKQELHSLIREIKKYMKENLKSGSRTTGKYSPLIQGVLTLWDIDFSMISFY